MGPFYIIAALKLFLLPNRTKNCRKKQETQAKFFLVWKKSFLSHFYDRRLFQGRTAQWSLLSIYLKFQTSGKKIGDPFETIFNLTISDKNGEEEAEEGPMVVNATWME